MTKDRSSKTFLKAREFLHEDTGSLTCMSGEVTSYGGYLDAGLKFCDGADTVYFDFASGDADEDLRRLNRLLSFVHNFRDAMITAHKWSEAKRKQDATAKEAKAE